MLDGAPPAAFDRLFFKAIETEGVLAPFHCLGGRTLIALDGTEHFCSRKIKCKRCSTRRRADGGTEYFHAFLGASMVAPGHKQVLPLPPEFIAPQDGAEKQDCERNAAKRWLARHGPASRTFGRSIWATICLPASRLSRPSIRRAATSSSPASHLRIRLSPNTCMAPSWKNIARPSSNAANAPPRSTAGSPPCRCAPPTTPSGRQLVLHRNPERQGQADLLQQLRHRSGHHRGNVAELAACGRARWKIENETFNVLKTNGYNLEHNFGHGKKTLASILVTLNLLAFGFHTAAISGCSPGEPGRHRPWRNTTASSSICGPSPPMLSSRTGIICSSPSPRPRYARPDAAAQPVIPVVPQVMRRSPEKTVRTNPFRIADLASAISPDQSGEEVRDKRLKR